MEAHQRGQIGLLLFFMFPFSIFNNVNKTKTINSFGTGLPTIFGYG